MKKGIVMQIDDHYLTLLTPDGQFMQAKKKNNQYELGEEIRFKPLEHSDKRKAFRFLSVKPLFAAAAILFLIIGALFTMSQSQKAYAYMSIDAKPSVEMGINKQMQVIKLTPYNADGKKIISEIKNWKNQKVTIIVQEFLHQMEQDGYLKNNHTVIISTVRTEKAEEKVDNQFIKDINVIKTIVWDNRLKLAMLTGTETEMEKAHKLGMTTGKYKETQIPMNRCRGKSQHLQESLKNQSQIHSQSPEQKQNPEKTNDSNKTSLKNANENRSTGQAVVKQPNQRSESYHFPAVTGNGKVKHENNSKPSQSNSTNGAVKTKVQQTGNSAVIKKDPTVTNPYSNWGQAKKNGGYLNWGQAKKNGGYLNWGQAKKYGIVQHGNGNKSF